MKVCHQIIGRNKIRDLRICLAYAEGLTPEEINSQGNISLTVRRVNQILHENMGFLEERIAWPKARRIHKLQRWIGNKESKKDPADLLEQVRKEVEGDKLKIESEVKVYTEEERKMRADRLAEFWQKKLTEQI